MGGVDSFAATISRVNIGDTGSKWRLLDYYPKTGIVCDFYQNRGIIESGRYQFPKNLTPAKLLALKGSYQGVFKTADYNIPVKISAIKIGNLSMKRKFLMSSDTGKASPSKGCKNLSFEN